MRSAWRQALAWWPPVGMGAKRDGGGERPLAVVQAGCPSAPPGCNDPYWRPWLVPAVDVRMVWGKRLDWANLVTGLNRWSVGFCRVGRAATDLCGPVTAA